MSALKGLKITPLMHLISVRCYTLPKSIVCTIMMNMLFSLIFAIHFLGSIYCMEESVSQKEDKRGRERERGRCLKIEAGIARTVFFSFFVHHLHWRVFVYMLHYQIPYEYTCRSAISTE